MHCDTQVAITHNTHVMPMNGKAHWRQYTDRLDTCPNPATVHVKVVYPEGQVVEKDLCDECARTWQAKVQTMESRRDIPSMGIVWPKSVWTITPLEDGA